MAGLPATNAEGETLSDAWDCKGRPAVRSQTGGWTSAAMILGVELCERLTTLGIAVNLVTYLTGTMHLGNATSANIVTNFLGTSFMLCLLGGFLADSFLGRYLTIAIFTAVQALGITILTISTVAPGLRPPACADPSAGGCVQAKGAQLGVLYLALNLTALGTGGLKSSVSGFGSDQFDESDRGEKRQMMRFFSWFFFFISLGSLLAVTVLVYIQDYVGREWGYGICAAAIVSGLAVFLAGTTRYRFKKLVGSPLTQIAAVVVAAWRKRALDLPSDLSLLHDVGAADKADDRGKQKLPHSKQFRWLGPGSDHRGPGRRAEQVATVYADRRGGGEAGDPDAAGVGHHHHVLDRLRPDDHLLGLPGHHDGPPHRPLLPDPSRLPHRLLCRLHPPHGSHLRPRRRPRRPPPHRQPAGPHPAPAHRRRPHPLHLRHGGRRAHGAQAPPRGLRGRCGVDGAAERVLAGAAVLLHGRRGGLHLHRPAGFLLEGVSQGDEDHEHRAVPQHSILGFLF
uniref:Protein NRT1/ PTR FAMILY 6.3 isoform X1 n=1 Tax=Elaeis guineensis var. tenera TaxID=51953 RepID=A0A6I9R2S4_ELAGV|nr:protein NRT1/ PTR FAMILY 6.3 isoform X1 [Elaeis guineensis]